MAVRELGCLPVLAASATLLLVTSVPPAAQDIGWPQAVDQLAREKTLAEACASILKTFAEGAPMARVQGERLYARAHADMDGLVRLFIADLAGERSPADSPELRQRLEAVPRQRRALCRHVDAAAGTALRRSPGRTAVAELLAKGSSDSVAFAGEAAVRIWQAYREANQVGRAAIIARIEAVRWLPYPEVPAA
jgi:hypothetical protein